jgi:hypothetical protein
VRHLMSQDTAVISASERAQYEALFDPITRLPRLALLVDRINVSLVRAHHVRCEIAVVILQYIKDPGGGPPDLAKIADELSSKLRIDDTVAQVGDGMLAVLCNEIAAEEDAHVIAQRLIEDSRIVSSITLTLSGEHRDAEAVLEHALEQAKH